MREYDLIADWYANERGGNTVGVAETLAMAAQLPSRSLILDLGSGSGIPITEALLKADYRVTGLDSSPEMLAIFRRNFPNAPAVLGDVRRCPFVDSCFDAAVSWGMMFHLSPADQGAAFASVSGVLKPGALFLFTAAEIESANPGGITGTMNGVTFRYYAVQNYQKLIAEHGLALVDVHEDPGVSTYYLARKSLR